MSEVAAPTPTATPSAAVSTPAPVDLDVKSAKTSPSQKEPTAQDLFDVTVDGKTLKLTKEEVLKRASLSTKAYDKFEEAAKMTKAAEAKLARLKTPKDAIKFLNDPELGLNPAEVREAFEEWYKESFIDPEAMSEEERETARLRKEHAELKKYREEQEAKAKEAEEKALDEQGKANIQKELTALLEESGMPKTKFTASRLAYWIRVNEAKGIQAPKEMIIAQVQAERNAIVKSMADSLDGEPLVEALGPDIVKKIRQYDLAQIRAKRGGQAPVEDKKQSLEPPTRRERITESEVKRRIRAFK